MTETLAEGLFGGLLVGIVSLVANIIIAYRTTKVQREEGHDTRIERRVDDLLARYEADIATLRASLASEHSERERLEDVVDTLRREKRALEDTIARQGHDLEELRARLVRLEHDPTALADGD